ncbi:MAG: hypothetical protein ABTR54_14870 [Candidatus Competibacter sp.]
MFRYRSFCLLVVALSVIVPLGIGHAQRHPDNELILELLDRVEQLESEVRYVRGELEIQRHQVEILQQQRALSGPPPYGLERPATAPATPSSVPERSTGSGQPEAVKPPASSTPPPNHRQLPIVLRLPNRRRGHPLEPSRRISTWP